MGVPEYRFDPHDPGFARDPWSVYRELRARTAGTVFKRLELPAIFPPADE